MHFFVVEFKTDVHWQWPASFTGLQIINDDKLKYRFAYTLHRLLHNMNRSRMGLPLKG